VAALLRVQRARNKPLAPINTDQIPELLGPINSLTVNPPDGQVPPLFVQRYQHIVRTYAMEPAARYSAMEIERGQACKTVDRIQEQMRTPEGMAAYWRSPEMQRQYREALEASMVETPDFSSTAPPASSAQSAPPPPSAAPPAAPAGRTVQIQPALDRVPASAAPGGYVMADRSAVVQSVTVERPRE